MPYERATFQSLATRRVAEARALAHGGHSSGAYYLAGYAIECALKAVIAGKFRENVIPDKSFVASIYTHNLVALLRLAGLQSELDDAIEADQALGQKWTIIQRWSEDARYQIWTADHALGMIDAVAGSEGTEGLLQWLTNR